MPRIRCPGCQVGLRIDDSKLGLAVRCPKCQHRFTLPPPEEAEHEEPVESHIVEKPKKPKPKSYELSDQEDAPRPTPRRRRRDEEQDESRPRIRKKRRAKQLVGLAGFLGAEWNLDKIVVVCSAGFWLLFAVLSLIHPMFVVGLFGIGFLMVIVARIWAIVAAFSEDVGAGCLTIFFPWYGLFGIEDRRPLFLVAVGLGYVLTGVGELVLANAMGRLN
jgi:predicted Zn finger-like uncharacterized protein